MKRKFLILSILPIGLSLFGCNKNSHPEKDYFQNWNKRDESALNTLINYVKDVTNEKSSNFIPKADRIATFDMDGTFVGELYPTYFEYNMLVYRAIVDPGYKDKAPEFVVDAAKAIIDKVTKGTSLPSDFDLIHAEAAAEAYSDMTVKQFAEYTRSYAQNTPFGFTGMTYATSFYKPMLEVFDYLQDNGFKTYVVSGSDRYLCRTLVENLNIPSDQIIGMDVELKASKQGDEDGRTYTMGSDETLVRTNNLLIKNLKTNKCKAIEKEIGKIPVLSFGNSDGDCAMHNYCKSNEKYKTEVFMVLADDYDDDYPSRNTTQKREIEWRENKYNIFSMHDDFKTIYGENVHKTEMTYYSYE